MPVVAAIPFAIGLPSAIMSDASIAMLNVKDSPGCPFTASGFPPRSLSAAVGCVHACVIVSGLN